MTFKGHDYMELAKKWGICDKIDDVITKLNEFRTYEDIIEDCDLLGAYIEDKLVWIEDRQGEFLPVTMRADIIEFLVALKSQEHANRATKHMADALLTCSTLDANDDGPFVRWFVLMLPKLWT